MCDRSQITSFGKNPVFLITQLCWLHQVKTNKKKEPLFLSYQSHFPPNRFSSIVQQFSLGINKHGDRQHLSFGNMETAWTLCAVKSVQKCNAAFKQQKKIKTTKPQTASLGLPETMLGAQVYFTYTFTPYYSPLQSSSVVATCDKHNMAFLFFFKKSHLPIKMSRHSAFSLK